jgi:hypothetical protein
MSSCLECRHLDLQKNPGHAKVGLGKCAFEREIGRFVPIPTDRECEKFKRADDEIVQARAEWWSKQLAKMGR